MGGGPWGNIGDIWGQRLKECQFLEIFPKQNVLSWRAGPGDQLHRRPDPLRPRHRARQEGGCQGDHRSIMMTMSKVRRKGIKVLQNFQELLLFLFRCFSFINFFLVFFHLSPGFFLLFAVRTIAFYSTHPATDSLNFASWPPLFSFWPVFSASDPEPLNFVLIFSNLSILSKQVLPTASCYLKKLGNVQLDNVLHESCLSLFIFGSGFFLCIIMFFFSPQM